MGTRQIAILCEPLVYLVIDTFIILRMMCQSKAYGSYHRHKMEFEHILWSLMGV